MEDDRAATNLGPDTDQSMPEEVAPVQKQPKRRFVGRKAGEKAGEQQADPNANIEDSSAIQGVRSPQKSFLMHRGPNMYPSCPASAYSSCPECDPRRDSARPRNQRRHRAPTAQLQLRDPQMYTPHTDIRSQVDSFAVSRGIAAIRNHHIRHSDAILPWYFDVDNG